MSISFMTFSRILWRIDRSQHSRRFPVLNRVRNDASPAVARNTDESTLLRRTDQMTSVPIKVLIADADASRRRGLRASLMLHGYTVEEARTGEEAVQCADRRKPDLVLLDIDMAGPTACQRLRAIIPQAGLVMIAGSDREDDKVRALEGGADDYVLKPFSARELIARMRAIARRTLAEAPESGMLRAGELELNTHCRTLLKGGVPVRLSPIEFDLLSYLMRHADTPIEHARLLRAIWGPESGSELEYLRTYMKRLRQKIERNPVHPEYLITVPWLGYSFCTSAPDRTAAASPQPC
jgi:two-component system KDP operon response regulator KdpE